LGFDRGIAEWRTERMAEWSNGRNGYIRTIYGRHTYTDDDNDNDNDNDDDDNDDDDDDDDDNDNNDDDDDDDEDDNDDDDTLIFYSIDIGQVVT
jgi:hypothetical protein